MATNSYLNELRIVMLGKTGAGKSSLGNNLLSDETFESLPGGQSVTLQSATGRRQLQDGREMIIVDTPGLFDTRAMQKETFLEICRCISLASPGPHIFMLVLRIGRFTQEELDTIEHVQSIFGDYVCKHMIIVFTGKESLEDDDKKKSVPLKQYVQKSPESLQKIIRQCGNRYVGVNNKARGGEIEAYMEGVMKLINQTMDENGGDYYTGEMYAAAEKALKEKIQKIEDEKLKEEREIQRRKEELDLKETEMNTKLDQQVVALEKHMADVKLRDELAQEEREKQEHELQKTKEEIQNREEEMKIIMDREREDLKMFREELQQQNTKSKEEKEKAELELQKRVEQTDKKHDEMMAQLKKQLTAMEQNEKDAKERRETAEAERLKEKSEIEAEEKEMRKKNNDKHIALNQKFKELQILEAQYKQNETQAAEEHTRTLRELQNKISASNPGKRKKKDECSIL